MRALVYIELDGVRVGYMAYRSGYAGWEAVCLRAGVSRGYYMTPEIARAVVLAHARISG